MNRLQSTKLESIKNTIQGLPKPSLCLYGCLESEIEQQLELATSLFPWHKQRVVRNWKWFDIEGTDADKKAAMSVGLILTFLFSEDITEVANTKVFDWVRTTMLSHFNKPGLFATKNTVYVLVGNGEYYSVSEKTAYKLFAGE